MGFTVEWDRESDTCVFKGSGHPGLADFRRATEEFMSQGPCKNTLWDLSACDLDRLSPSDFLEVSLMRVPMAKDRMRGKTAVVASSDVVFGLARMVEGLSPEVETTFKVFREPLDARAWLAEE